MSLVSSNRDRVQRYPAALRAKGLRPRQIWVPDTKAPGFAEQARRECLAINAAEEHDGVMEWLEAVSVFDEDHESLARAAPLG